MLIVINNRLLKLSLILSTPVNTIALILISGHLGQHPSRLLTAHHRNPRVGPHKHKAGVIGATTHTVITSPKRPANNHRKLRHISRSHGRYHLGSMLGNTFILILLAHHKASDILQKYQRNLALGTELNKVRAFLGRLTKQNAIVGHNTHGVAKDTRKATDQGGAIERLKLIKIRAIHHPGNHLPHIVGFTRISRHHTVNFMGIIGRLNSSFKITIDRLNTVESSDSLAGQI